MGDWLVVRELRLWRWWWLLGAGLVALVWWLSLIPRPPHVAIENGDKLGHFAAYAAQVAWFGWLLTRRWLRWVALLFVIQGVLLEGLQGLTGYRQPDLYDIAANSIGAGMGYAVAALSGGFLLWLEGWLPGARAALSSASSEARR